MSSLCTAIEILPHQIIQEKADDETNQLFVFFPEDEKVGVKPIKILTDRMKDESVSNAILVLRGDITPFAKQAVQEMSDSFRIEHFKEAELLVDITDHILVRIASGFRAVTFCYTLAAHVYKYFSCLFSYSNKKNRFQNI